MSVTAQGYIYFIVTRPPNGKKIKIGFSKNARERLKVLSTGSPVKLELLLTIPGTLQGEHALHRRFAAHRMNGEWFRGHKEIWAYIDDHLDRIDAEYIPSADNPWDVTCGLIPS